jgi:hypothetical protein
MPGIAEFLAEGPYKLIVAEMPDGSVMLTQVDTIRGERHSITLSPRTALQDRAAHRVLRDLAAHDVDELGDHGFAAAAMIIGFTNLDALRVGDRVPGPLHARAAAQVSSLSQKPLSASRRDAVFPSGAGWGIGRVAEPNGLTFQGVEGSNPQLPVLETGIL